MIKLSKEDIDVESWKVFNLIISRYGLKNAIKICKETRKKLQTEKNKRKGGSVNNEQQI